MLMTYRRDNSRCDDLLQGLSWEVLQGAFCLKVIHDLDAELGEVGDCGGCELDDSAFIQSHCEPSCYGKLLKLPSTPGLGPLCPHVENCSFASIRKFPDGIFLPPLLLGGHGETPQCPSVHPLLGSRDRKSVV